MKILQHKTLHHQSPTCFFEIEVECHLSSTETLCYPHYDRQNYSLDYFY